MIKGLKARTIKSKFVPAGFMAVSSFAKKLEISTAAVYTSLKNGKIPAKHMLYWRCPDTKRDVLILSDDAIKVYKENTRTRKVAQIKKKKEDQEKRQEEKEDEINKIGTPPPEEINIYDITNLNEAKTQREIIRMKKEALELQKAQNSVVSLDRMKRLSSEMGTNIRQRLLATVPRIAALVSAESDARRNMAILQEEFENILKVLVKAEDLV